MRIIFACLILLFAYFLTNMLNVYEPFKKILPVDNDCRIVRGDDKIAAIEDLIHYGRFLIGSSDDRMKLWMRDDFGVNKTENGFLAVYDKSRESDEIIKVKIEDFPAGTNFHPHGIFIFKNKTLYVINHAYAKGGERIEVLDIYWDKTSDKVKISYLRSIPFPDDFAGILNDLAVVGEGDKFYVSTFLPFKDDVLNGRKSGPLKSYLSKIFLGLNLKFTYLYYCETNNCTQIPGTSSLENNGIAYDMDKTLYAVNVVERKLRVFHINKADMTRLIPVRDIQLEYPVDNIDYDPQTGEIYAAAIGSLFEQYKFIQEVLRTKKHASHNYWSGALKIDTKNNFKVSVVNMQKDFMYGVSSAIKERNILYMGSWIDKGLLICKLK